MKHGLFFTSAKSTGLADGQMYLCAVVPDSLVLLLAIILLSVRWLERQRKTDGVRGQVSKHGEAWNSSICWTFRTGLDLNI